MLTPEQILTAAHAAMPRMPDHAAIALREAMGDLQRDLTTELRASSFFGNLGVESSDLNTLEENLNYSAGRLPQVWPSRFKGKPDKVARCARNPKGLANEVYANRMGNGPPSSGDGWRFRGQGPLQMTGKNNFATCSKDIGIDLVANPEKAQQLDVGLKIALWFFNKNGVFKLIDAGNLKAVTKRINGGYHGHAERVSKTNRAMQALKSGMTYASATEADEPQKMAGDRPYLRKGSRGGHVADLQAALKIDDDGIFGNGTKAAVVAFQAANGLDADGVVGPATWAALDKLEDAA
jgi:putative chitinase